MAEHLNPMRIEDPETGEVYNLRFTRATVRKAEESGFDITQLESKGMTMIPILFWSAFLADRPYIKQSVTNDILVNKLNGLTPDEMGRLGALYAEPFNSLISSEDEPSNPRRMTVTL